MINFIIVTMIVIGIVTSFIIFKLIKLYNPIDMKLTGKVLLEKRNKSIPLYDQLPHYFSKLYLWRFDKKIDGKLHKFIKIGKTKFVDVHDRAIYNHQAFVEGKDTWVETSMYLFFDNLTVLSSVQAYNNVVDEGEKKILRAWGGKSDVSIPKMGGMSEIFEYTKQREMIARDYFKKIRY